MSTQIKTDVCTILGTIVEFKASRQEPLKVTEMTTFREDHSHVVQRIIRWKKRQATRTRYNTWKTKNDHHG